MVVDSATSLGVAHRVILRLLAAGDGRGAIAYAEAVTGSPDQDFNLKQLRAIAYTEAAKLAKDRSLAERGAEIWRELEPEKSSAMAYNLANAELSTFQIALEQGDLSAAWDSHRHHLHAARAGYELVAADPKARRELRLQALTNLGNAYDVVGRDLEAREYWDRALAIDPDFGMALGNRGISLATFAPFMSGHSPTVRSEAAADLDSALAAEASVLRFGGPQALASFKSHRKKLGGVKGNRPDGKRGVPWSDPHLEWCRRHELFLHVSHSCLREDTDRLDPLAFRGLATGLTDADQERVHDLVDMLNSIKQDYLAARLATWLATAEESPVRLLAAAVSGRATFLDSLRYARFGARTGLAVQAFSAATNVLDKAAVMVHSYLRTGRAASDISFRWIARPVGQQKGGLPKPMDSELVAALARPERNLGLIALCDLSCELEGNDTLLKRFAGRRHAATHRFLVAHTEGAPPSTEWIERLRWPQLVSESITQLKLARAAIVYVVRTTDRHESVVHPPPPTGTVRPRLEIPAVDTDLVEYE